MKLILWLFLPALLSQVSGYGFYNRWVVDSSNPSRGSKFLNHVGGGIAAILASQTKEKSETEEKGESLGSKFIRNAVNSVGESVVRIIGEKDMPTGLQFLRIAPIKVTGSGIITTEDGYILTNAHVIDDTQRLTVTLSNGRTFKAKVVGVDEFTDLAVLKADLSKEDPSFKLKKAPLGDSSRIHSGDWAIALGCPVGLDFTVTLGIVSNPHRSAVEIGAPFLKGTYIQTDAALNSGNSGGPLCNAKGEVIGVNSMARLRSEAIGFAIPINRALKIAQVLMQGKKPAHCFFGMHIAYTNPDLAKINNENPNTPHIPPIYGSRVKRILTGSPAEKCGLRKNDIITEINGRKIGSMKEAESILDDCVVGKAATFVIIRGEGHKRLELSAVPADLSVVTEEKRKKEPKLPFSSLEPAVLPEEDDDNPFRLQ